MPKNKMIFYILSLCLIFGFSGCGNIDDAAPEISQSVKDSISSLVTGQETGVPVTQETISVVIEEEIPEESVEILIPTVEETVTPAATAIPERQEYDWTPYYIENNNIPYFTREEITTEVFENYSELDALGRCGVAYANICKELMPTEERGEIGQVKPAGWHTVKYDCVNGKYLYNRCHLIGFQLAGENANEKNLITGTRYLNIDGMLSFENEIADYVKDTGNHVLYRVTPRYTDKNLLCDGLLMEAYSVEDKGKGVQFCVFARNIQPGVWIDYKTGDSHLLSGNVDYVIDPEKMVPDYTKGDKTYIVNRNTHKFHEESCEYAISMKAENREEYNGSINWLYDNGFEACKKCIQE